MENPEGIEFGQYRCVLINLEKVRTSIMGDDAILENQIPKITF